MNPQRNNKFIYIKVHKALPFNCKCLMTKNNY